MVPGQLDDIDAERGQNPEIRRPGAEFRIMAQRDSRRAAAEKRRFAADMRKIGFPDRFRDFAYRKVGPLDFYYILVWHNRAQFAPGR